MVTMPPREPWSAAERSESEGSGAGKPHLPADKLADALQSRVINAFEAAIDQGMTPMDALAVILAWMSSEMMRIQADQAKGPI